MSRHPENYLIGDRDIGKKHLPRMCKTLDSVPSPTKKKRRPIARNREDRKISAETHALWFLFFLEEMDKNQFTISLLFLSPLRARGKLSVG
jgi:hypothetical protein